MFDEEEKQVLFEEPVGTENTMAPEMIEGNEYDGK